MNDTNSFLISSCVYNVIFLIKLQLHRLANKMTVAYHLRTNMVLLSRLQYGNPLILIVQRTSLPQSQMINLIVLANLEELVSLAYETVPFLRNDYMEAPMKLEHVPWDVMHDKYPASFAMDLNIYLIHLNMISDGHLLTDRYDRLL